MVSNKHGKPIEADNGVTVEGWLLKPSGFQEGRKYPVVLQIHGGPHVAYGLTFNHEMQVLCGLGKSLKEPFGLRRPSV